jgi:hypothetical protein
MFNDGGREMNTRQIIAYAEDNGFNKVKFSLKRNGRHLCAGRFLDAYYELVTIPVLGDGFITISQLEQDLGYDIEFEVIDEEQYVALARLDFILRGKQPPKELAFAESEDKE